MQDPDLMLYQPKQQPDELLQNIKQKLISIDASVQVYFCIAAWMANNKIEEKKVIGINLDGQVSNLVLQEINKMTDELMKQDKDLLFVKFNDSKFKAHFEQEGPVFSI